MKKYLLILLFYHLPLHAEVITDGTLGTTNLSGPNYQIEATLGQQQGNNLFHSFREFNLNSSESAIFSGPNNIQNIISRVTGGNPSNIDGLIQSTIPNADFYFLNPYGIMFGPNASLDVQGSFHASTANYLRLGENGKFSASHPEQSILTVAEPKAFGFLDSPDSINVQNSILSVPLGKTLSLVGGDINISDGTLLAESGQIHLVASASSGEFYLNDNLITFEQLGKIYISQSAINKRFTQFTGKSLIEYMMTEENNSPPPPANIDASGFQGGRVFIRAGQLILNKGSIFSDTFEGDGDNIDIFVDNVQLKNGARITTHNFGNNQGGDINIIANKITFTGINNEFYNPSDFNTIGTDNYGYGTGGNIDIKTDYLNINHGFISSTSEPKTDIIDIDIKGKAGNINITEAKEITINGIRSDDTQYPNEIIPAGVFLPSSISSSSFNSNAGNIWIETNILKVNHAEINTFASGDLKGNAGNSSITANIASFYNSKLISENQNAIAGNISLNIEKMLLADNTLMFSLTEGTEIKDTGGKITVNKPQFFVLNTSKINTTANVGADGEILIDSDYFIQSNNSTLEGDIIINSGQENFSNSLVNLPKTLADASKLLAKSCIETTQDDSDFIVTSNLSDTDIEDLLNNPQPFPLQAKLTEIHQSLKLNQQELTAIQLLNAPYQHYKLQWQRGRLFKKIGKIYNAIAAYQNAIAELTKIRPHLTKIYKKHFPNGERSELRDILKPIFTELIELILQKPDADLKQVLQIINQLKTAELQDYFQDDCTKPTMDLEQVDKSNTAIVYPIFLSNQVELIVSLPGEQRLHKTLVSTPEQLTQTIHILAKKLNCRECKKDDSYLVHAQQLYDWLIRPIETELSNKIETLVFVPDGPLYSIPMAVLHDGKQFLIDKYALALTPNLTINKPNKPTNLPNKMLYNVLTEYEHSDFEPIKQYAIPMQTELKKTFGSLTTIKGKNFIRSSLSQALHFSHNMLHIFSHAQFSPNIKDTFIVTYNEKLEMDQLEKLIAPKQHSEAPLELLVLSACETAKGDERAALGLAGVAYKAGVRSAVATLWPVQDRLAYFMFKEFYQKIIKEQQSKAKALQQAQLILKQYPNWQHPHYWAAFLIIGQWW